MSTEEDEYDIIELVDADGNEVPFVLLGVVPLDGAEYALMSPQEQVEGEGDHQDIFVFTYEHDEEEGVENFGPLEDEELLARVQAVAETMMEEDEDGEE